MPAVSKAQQKLFGLVKAVKAGKAKTSSVSKDVKDIAKTMTTKEIDKFAGTKHKGLPEKKKEVKKDVKKESLQIQELRNTIREVIKQSLREDINEFDFEDFDNTDLNGSSVEIAIDELFGEFQKSIDKVLSANAGLKSKARIAIKQMIVDKLKQWK
jgi:hypothetical protein